MQRAVSFGTPDSAKPDSGANGCIGVFALGRAAAPELTAARELTTKSDLKPKLAERDILTAGPASAGLGVVGMSALVIAALYVGREVFVPVALAILLSFVLAPLIRLLQKARMPRALAVVGIVLVAFAGITALATVMATQVTQLAGDLPRYQATMREKVQSLRGSAAGGSALERAADVLQAPSTMAG